MKIRVASLALLVLATFALAKETVNYQRWVAEDVYWIISLEEQHAFTRLNSDEDRQAFIEQFWSRRNPGGNSQNAFKEEHYRRVAYSNEHFKSQQQPGFRTDRGRVFILYGPPDSISPQLTNGLQSEIWHYEKLPQRAAAPANGVNAPSEGTTVDFVFLDDCDCNEYHLQAAQ